MHLKLDQSGTIDDGEVARDLGQQTADIVILSAADNELAALAAARSTLGKDFPSVQFTNLLALRHPMSVDLYVERTLRSAKLVVLRMLGGESYWPYGVESLRADAVARGTAFACLPGELSFDPSLSARGTVAEAQLRELWRYFCEGGADNLASALRYAAHLIGRAERPAPPRPMPAAGFWPAEPVGDDARPKIPILFYRALAASADTEPVEALRSALKARGLQPVPIFLTSLKDERSIAFIRAALGAYPPQAIINVTAFATALGTDDAGVLAEFDCPILQVAFAGCSRAAWERSPRGLLPRDLAMHVALPEVDGRIFTHAVAFKEQAAPSAGGFAPTLLRSLPDRIDATADLAAAWARLREQPREKRLIAIVLANYPNRDGRLANGVGLDTPASLMLVLEELRRQGYAVDGVPASSAEMMQQLQRGPTNNLADRATRNGGIAWPLKSYREQLTKLPQSVRDAVEARWGRADIDPHVGQGRFRLGLHQFGNVVVGIQPARGYNIDPKATAHDPDLVPPHNYLAFYLWLREVFAADAIIHLGKHGNLEWLPGKSVGLSENCFPGAILGAVPNLYPFIVNDPGEGIQARRRTAAVIVDHLTPPLARAELHGDLARLETLVDEYAVAADLDPKRAAIIADDIVSLARAAQLDADLKISRDGATVDALRTLDSYLCDLKELQIRDGLHVFGRQPVREKVVDLLVAIARLPRSDRRPEDASLHRAIAADLGLGEFDPLAREFAAPYSGPWPEALLRMSSGAWRSRGDTVERIEWLAAKLVGGEIGVDPAWTQTLAVLDWIARCLRPAIEACAAAELASLMRGLDGRFVNPGPSGAPSRGRPEVLPTGRNFFAVDIRAVPTPSAWRTARLAAERLVEQYYQDAGEWPRAIALSAWGTANMRTGGDDVAQVLALIGAEPVWEETSGRVIGFTITPLSALRRPRIDVTLRVSGLFRDAFPNQMDLIDSAVRAIAELNEPDDANPIAANARKHADELAAQGAASDQAWRQATSRVFGSKPGAYGVGLQVLVDEGGWDKRTDIADVYLSWSSFAYGGGQDGAAAADDFERRLAAVDLVAHTQDNREHDILDSDDYYQFMGGLASAVETLSGRAPRIAHVDTSRPEAPVARPLADEISRVVRGRAANPKWIAGVMRHGYKGAFEIAATVDYLFGFAASTNAVGNHHFDQLFKAYIENDAVRSFMAESNPAALRETAARFEEAVRRGLWTPRSNSAADLLKKLLPPQQKESAA
jgi:cobaltochelatase CobN